MTLKHVVFAAALLALTQGVLALPVALQERLNQRKSLQSCNPHLRMPNGTRMAADVVSYYNEKCLGGLVMSLFKFQAGIKLFEHMEDTVICHGYVKLLSLIDAYQWTEEMCENKVIEDERAHFCERYDDDQKNIEELANRYGAIGYNDLTTIAKVLSALEGEGKCKDFCGGIMNSVLCGSFVDASRFFLDKFESGKPQLVTNASYVT